MDDCGSAVLGLSLTRQNALWLHLGCKMRDKHGLQRPREPRNTTHKMHEWMDGMNECNVGSSWNKAGLCHGLMYQSKTNHPNRPHAKASTTSLLRLSFAFSNVLCTMEN